MKIAKKQEDEIGFQLAPMIDMTFLLLIFFMVTTKISKDQVKVDIKLPTAANATIPNDISNRDIISIDAVAGTIDLEVAEEVLAERRAKWQPRTNDYQSGALWRYQQVVGKARYGALTHPGAKAETHVFADI